MEYPKPKNLKEAVEIIKSVIDREIEWADDSTEDIEKAWEMLDLALRSR